VIYTKAWLYVASSSGWFNVSLAARLCPNFWRTLRGWG
jgi:hypothetical protein